MSELEKVSFELDALEDAEERAAKVRELFEAGRQVPRDVAIQVLGRAHGIGWMDMIAVPEIVSASVEPGGMVTAEAGAIPAAEWEKHRADYSDPKGHGLKLENEPAVVGLFRYPDGKCGAVIGYCKAG